MTHSIAARMISDLLLTGEGGASATDEGYSLSAEIHPALTVKTAQKKPVTVPEHGKNEKYT